MCNDKADIEQLKQKVTELDGQLAVNIGEVGQISAILRTTGDTCDERERELEPKIKDLQRRVEELETRLNGIDKLVESGSDIKEDLQEEAEKLASQYADTIISTSQPSGSPADLSAAQREEGAVRVMLVAMTWVLKAGNRQMWFINEFRKGKIGWNQLARHFAFEWWMPAMAQLALPTLLYAEDDRPDWWHFFYNPIHDSMAWMPGVSQVLNTARYGASEIPALEGITQTVRAGQSFSKGDFVKGTENMAKALFWWTGMPIDNPPRDLGKYWDRITGD